MVFSTCVDTIRTLPVLQHDETQAEDPAVAADLAHPDRFAQVTGAALVRYERIDALVNNAGIGRASVRRDRKPIRFWQTTRPSNGAASSPSMSRTDQHGTRGATPHVSGKER